MGMYTELVFGARLQPGLPGNVVKALQCMVKGSGKVPEELPDHEFFQSERWERLFHCGSYSFGIHRPHAIMEWDDISNSYSLSTRSSLKNYDGEIQKFLDWIKPYVNQGSGTRDMFAMVCYEEDEAPTLYFLEK